MPKRKRDDAEDNGDVEIEDQALRIRVSRLKAKVDQGNQSITTALKLARGFERQKLGRREKAALRNPKELLRRREEVIVLKTLDLPSIAKKHLVKQLVKTKRIRESPAFITVYGEKPGIEPPKSGAEANVVARLFSSNPVREILPGIMSGIYKCLGIEERQHAGDTAQKKPAIAGTSFPPEMNTDGSFEGFSEAEPELNSNFRARFGTDAESIDDSEDDALPEYGDRLASSPDEPEERKKNGYTLSRLANQVSNGQSHDRQASDQLSRSHSPSISDSDLSLSPPPNSRPVKSAPPKPSGTSFLPSLSLGGYYSGSESDDDTADRRYDNSGALPQVRNNRRGQRARQKIAEKKYGKNAKHLAKQKSQNAARRDAGWDSKRGATDAKSRFGRSKLQRQTNGPTGANAGVVTPKNSVAKSDKPLHPSWEAAKKRKEDQKPSLAFSGKKITFD